MDSRTLDQMDLPWPLPPELEQADPDERLAEDLRLIRRLREMLIEQRAQHKKSQRALLLKLLEVADGLERILALPVDSDDPNEVHRRTSIQITLKLLQEAFRMQRVAPIEVLGKQADPLLCEIEGYQTFPDLPEETVIQELIKGYVWEEEPTPLRTAVVVVSCRE